MECGNISDPPSRSKRTIWCIVELVIMGIVGLNCLFGFFDCARIGGFLSLLGIIGNGFGIAGLLFVCFALWKENGAFMKIGILCYAVCLIMGIVVFVFTLFHGVSGSSIIHVIFDVILCIIFWMQSGNLK